MNFRLIFLILLLHFIFLQNNHSQTVVFEERVDTTPDWGMNGPNKKNFLHFFIGTGAIIGPSENIGSNIIYGVSSDFEFGYRYKRKISNFYSCGIDFGYHGSSFVLQQDSSKTLPNAVLNKKETFRFYTVALGLYNRFNFGKRGNIVGNYFDCGASLEYPLSVVYDIKNDGANGTIVRTLTSHLDYINKYNYYGFIRLGTNRYSIKAAYRFSDLFKQNETYNYAELPRIILALQIGIHK